MQKPPQPLPRHWLKDGLSALAFLGLAIVGGRGVARLLGPVGGLFYLTITLGLAYFFGRAAWQGLLTNRRR